MAKKKTSKKSKSFCGNECKDLLGKFFDSLTGAGVRQAVKSIKEGVKDTVDYAYKGVNRLVSTILRAIAMFVLVIIGLIMAFVGLANYLGFIWELDPGLGLLIVGGALVVIGVFVSSVRR